MLINPGWKFFFIGNGMGTIISNSRKVKKNSFKYCWIETSFYRRPGKCGLDGMTSAPAAGIKNSSSWSLKASGIKKLIARLIS